MILTPIFIPAIRQFAFCRLLTIGVEMVANPSVLFLDEPTSGLDSRAALIVMRVVKKIVRTGRTVLCTIHQPSSEVFFLFDRLLLLRTGGRLVYFGPCGYQGQKIVEYFTKVNPDARPIAKQENPASWMLESPLANEEIDYPSIWLQSDEKKIADMETVGASKPTGEEIVVGKYRYAAPYTTQYLLVQMRAFRSWWRNLAFNEVRLMSATILGLVYGLVYLNIDAQSFAGIQSKLAGIFLCVSFGGVINAMNAMPTISAERAVYYRERASSTYAPWTYAVTLFVTEIPYIFVGSCGFCLPFCK
jgi:energy-coupling factor transporter ATP-binding protein EcfA2